MDYTKLPRPLVYKEKTTEEFMRDEWNEKLLDTMFAMCFQSMLDAENRMVECLNTAYYLCTIILLDDKPLWRKNEYFEKAYPSTNDYRYDIRSMTLGVTSVLLALLGVSEDKKYSTLMNTFLASIPMEYKDKLLDAIRGINKRPTRKSFAPRKVDEVAVREVYDWGKWRDFTDDYDENRIWGILRAVNSDEDGDKKILFAISKEAKTFCSGERRIQVLNMLSDIDEGLFYSYHKEYFESEMEESAPEPSLDKELGEEVEQLMAENQQLRSRNDYYEDLQQAELTIEEQKKEIERLKQENEQQKEKVNIPRKRIRIEMLNFLFAKLGKDTDWITKNRKALPLARVYAVIMGVEKPNGIRDDVGRVVYNEHSEELNRDLEEINGYLQNIDNDWRITL